MKPQAEIEHIPFPIEKFRELIGGKNWVLHRRTNRIVERYGKDVICLSQKQYNDAETKAWLSLTEGFD